MTQRIQSKQTASPEKSYSPAQMNAYFLELERLLAQVECGGNNYRLLGVESSATRLQIRTKYQQALALLFPPAQISDQFPPEIFGRIDAVFAQLTRAFAVLGSCRRRAEYDQALSSGKDPAAELEFPTATAVTAVPGRSYDPEARAIPIYNAQERNRRRNQRNNVKLPVQVNGVDRRGGEWQEQTGTLDVSATGLMLLLQHPVRLGAVLYLSLPMPRNLRSYDRDTAEWQVYAIVRRIRPAAKGSRAVGLEFIGSQPPKGYRQTPWASFRTGKWQGHNRRRHDRVVRNETVFLEYLDEQGVTVLLDTGVTENISRTGMRIRVSPITVRFETVRLSSWDRQSDYSAIVVDRFVGQDGEERLCLHFPDKEFPV